MRILVVGGRYHTSRAHVEGWLASMSPTVVISNGLIGAPVYARQWAEREGVTHRLTGPVDIVLAFEGAGPIDPPDIPVVEVPNEVAVVPPSRPARAV